MSRIGKKPVIIPDGVNVTIVDGTVTVKGAKGQHVVTLRSEMAIKLENNEVIVERPDDTAKMRALHGTSRQLIANAVQGVSEGYSKELQLIGVGYQAVVEGQRLKLVLGYSHDIYFDPPEGITITSVKNLITVSGIDKQVVGEVSAKIRSFRKPEPYKGKGIRYKDEYVRSKQGKTVGS